MGIRRIIKTSLVVTVTTGLAVLVVHQCSTDPLHAIVSRNLSEGDTEVVYDRVGSYSGPGSIAAVINTAKMGTGGLERTFCDAWSCPTATPVPHMAVHQCGDGRRIVRTHDFGAGLTDVQEHRKQYPEGRCLVVTALRGPASWFGSSYLQDAKDDWGPKEGMLEDYREFLAADHFNALRQVLPDLLEEFDAGTLVQQAEVMDENGGYSLTPAPEGSALAGCDLLFLRMEQSDRWPDIFMMLDTSFENKRGDSRLEDYPDNKDQIDAIAAYELTLEEKFNVYNRSDEFIQDWFDAYKYMDSVTSIKS